MKASFCLLALFGLAAANTVHRRQDDGYDDVGYNDDGYNDDGYNDDGYNDDGYNDDGYNDDGHNDDGYKHGGHKDDDHKHGGHKGHDYTDIKSLTTYTTVTTCPITSTYTDKGK